MKDFTYNTPTKVFFGRGVERKVGETLFERGYRKVLLHFGGGSVKKSGLLDVVIDSLVSAGLSIVQLGGVEPNPKVTLVREGIKLAKEQQIDCILAVGGGSVIDSAKGIALGLANDADPWEMIKNLIPSKKGFPLSVVLTISAAGSEMSQSVVLSDSETYLKRGANHELVRPEFAFENPEYSCSVSPYQTACGIVDIMMHTLERYYTPDADTELVDRLAEGLIVAVKNAGTVAMADPDDYEARATLMWASSLSHNGLTGCGKQPVFPVHKLEHDISGLFDSVSHGAGLAVLFPAWAKFIHTHDVRKFAQGAVRMWGVEMDYDHPERTALRGIDAMRDYFASIGMPVTLDGLGVPESSYEQLADMSTDGGKKSVKSYIDLGRQEILEIFALAK